MDNAQLLSHVDTDLVTRDQLALIPAPQPTATWHPIPHIQLIETLQQALWDNRIDIREEKFALRGDGSTLFGVLQLAYQDTKDGQAAMGIRTSNDKSMSVQICAGLSVFVCDNLVFRGDLIALNRKHTSGLDLPLELDSAVQRFREHFHALTREIEELKDRQLTKDEAKALIHDVFANGLMPLRFLPVVSTMYFHPQIAAWEPRTAWTLHNAFTAVAKDMPISTRMPAIQELGRMLGMSSASPEKTIDGEVA
jgi:Domain of unknown function (DUF932)